MKDTLGRIAHHLQALLPYDDLTVYEVEDGGETLRPLFALGPWVDEIMAESWRPPSSSASASAPC